MQKNRITWQQFFRFLVLINTLFLIVACSHSHDMRDLKKYIEDQKNIAAQTQNPVPADNKLKFPVSTIFIAKDTRSPFEEVSSSAVAVKNHPLQSYPINTLKFKGTVTQGNTSIAFILAPDNKLYQVKTGDIIGEHYGKILNIYPDRLEVEEGLIEQGQMPAKQLIILKLKESS